MPLPHCLRSAAAVACVVAAAAPHARADEFTDRANALYQSISQSKRSDVVVLPAVAKMQPVPAVVGTVERAMMLPATSASFKAAAEWAAAEPQQAVIAALDSVTREQNFTEAFAFGQPYGADALATSEGGIALIRAELYTDLGDTGMLAGARFLYLPALDRVACLVNAEATRLAAAGEHARALDVLTDWLFFSRQIADRAFFQESRWGWRAMIAAADRLRDVVYTDFRAEHKITNEMLGATLDRIRADGYISLDRVLFPRANQIAAEQVIAKVFIPRAGVNEAVFGATMARLAATQRPLRLFAEAARWNAAASQHANFFQTGDELRKVYGDLASRWPLEPFDARMAYVSDFEKLQKSRFAVIAAVIPDMTVLYNDRQVCRAQLVGTRMALGIMAFQNRNKNWPPDIASIRPTWVRVIEADPYNPDRAQGKLPPLEFFVPNRERKPDPREEARPHQINVVPLGGLLNFQARVGSDQFVLYSVGPDGAKQWAANVSAEPHKGAVGDLLLWPPVSSLLRQRLTETGELK